jgi:hypothetical protein
MDEKKYEMNGRNSAIGLRKILDLGIDERISHDLVFFKTIVLKSTFGNRINLN